MNSPFRLLGRNRQLELELELETRLAARALARARIRKEREPIKAVARQICAELGRPIPPALQESSK